MGNHDQAPNPTPVIRQFLSECPEHIPEVRTVFIDGQEEIVLSSDGVEALTEWAIKTGRIPPESHERARATVAQMKQAAAVYAVRQEPGEQDGN